MERRFFSSRRAIARCISCGSQPDVKPHRGGCDSGVQGCPIRNDGLLASYRSGFHRIYERAKKNLLFDVGRIARKSVVGGQESKAALTFYKNRGQTKY